MSFQLAQADFLMRGSKFIDAPAMAQLSSSIQQMRRLAENAPGFVRSVNCGISANSSWPLYRGHVIVNVCVWQDVEHFRDFVQFSSRQIFFERARIEARMGSHTDLALWWIPEGSKPSTHDAAEALDSLNRVGPSANAFNLSCIFPPQSMYPTLDQKEAV